MKIGSGVEAESLKEDVWNAALSPPLDNFNEFEIKR